MSSENEIEKLIRERDEWRERCSSIRQAGEWICMQIQLDAAREIARITKNYVITELQDIITQFPGCNNCKDCAPCGWGTSYITDNLKDLIEELKATYVSPEDWGD